MFNTNATNLTDKMAHDILEAGLDSIFFSIDGLKEQYEKNRIGVSGRGLYSISNRNTENLTTVTSQSSSDRLLTDNLFDSDRVNFNINPYYELNSGNNIFFTVVNNSV